MGGVSSGASFSGGLVRTTSGMSVRDLIRRHRSRQSMENMAETGRAAAPQPPTRMGGGSGDFDLIRPPSRRGSAESSNVVVRDVVDVAPFDPSMPLSVLIVEDTDACEYAPPSAGSNAFYGPSFSPVFPASSSWMLYMDPRFCSPFSLVILNPLFVLNNTKQKQAPKT